MGMGGSTEVEEGTIGDESSGGPDDKVEVE